MSVSPAVPFGKTHPAERPLRWSTLTACLLLAAALAACSGTDEWDGPESGIAVVVESASGELAPGVFDGSLEAARERGGAQLLFPEAERDVHVVPPGTAWFVVDDAAATEDPPGSPSGGLAIVVTRSEGSPVPGTFRGPDRLARVIASSAPGGQEGEPSDNPFGLVIGDEHSRVQIFAPGSRVRLQAGNGA